MRCWRAGPVPGSVCYGCLTVCILHAVSRPQVIDAVLAGRACAGFCPCAEPDGPAAARHALSRCQRLLVVDWRDSPLCGEGKQLVCLCGSVLKLETISLFAGMTCS